MLLDDIVVLMIPEVVDEIWDVGKSLEELLITLLGEVGLTILEVVITELLCDDDRVGLILLEGRVVTVPKVVL